MHLVQLVVFSILQIRLHKSLLVPQVDFPALELDSLKLLCPNLRPQLVHLYFHCPVFSIFPRISYKDRHTNSQED
jgi:hypothetical protein